MKYLLLGVIFILTHPSSFAQEILLENAKNDSTDVFQIINKEKYFIKRLAHLNIFHDNPISFTKKRYLWAIHHADTTNLLIRHDLLTQTKKQFYQHPKIDCFPLDSLVLVARNKDFALMDANQNNVNSISCSDGIPALLNVYPSKGFFFGGVYTINGTLKKIYKISISPLRFMQELDLEKWKIGQEIACSENHQWIAFSDFPLIIDAKEYVHFLQKKSFTSLFVINIKSKKCHLLKKLPAQEFNPYWKKNKLFFSIDGKVRCKKIH